ncbi:MAG: cyclase family protein [Chloroflexi bacterium]|nr:cyclase family protein [Chloroflexota bacterium]
MVHWPGDAPISLERTSDVERGDSHTLSRISMGSHTGTHIDAPRHFIKGSPVINQMPFDATIGRARILEIKDAESIKPAELIKHHIRRGERLLFKTRNSTYVWQTDSFVEDFVFISDAAANFLASRQVKTVGIDYLSVGGFKKSGSYVHRTLLGAGIWLIEGLDLSRVTAGRYYLVCLPLKLADGDGAPARVIIKPV